MKLKTGYYLLIAGLAIAGCDNKGKEAALWDCANFAAMSRENQFLLLQGVGCGSLFAGSSSGDSAAGAAGEAATTTTVGVGEYEAVVPTAEITPTESTPDQGDFDGFTFYGIGEPYTGFVAAVPAGSSDNAAELGAALIAELGGLAEIDNVSIVSSQVIPDVTDTVVYQVGLDTTNPHTSTELSNYLLSQVGTSVDPGTVTNLPDNQAGEGQGDEFRAVIQVTQNDAGDSLIGIGVTLSTDYPAAEASLVGFLDGTNIGTQGAEIVASSASFIASGAAKADFLWVVDNSGSMSDEQGSVVANATNFFDRMTTTGLDFSIGVITTDSSTLRGAGFTNDKTQFQSDINAGISGSGTEAGIYWAEQALNPGGSVSNAGFPAADSSLTVVFLSDEGDHYACKTGGSKNNGDPACTGGTPFDQNTNVFLDLGVKVYSIIGLDATSGEPGTCNGGTPKATSGNNADPSYYNLAQNTGGSSASICNTDYSAILENIATQAAATASDYALNETPISSSIRVTVNGSEVARSLQNGFFYNSASNSLIFTGRAIPAAGAIIEVGYNRFQ